MVDISKGIPLGPSINDVGNWEGGGVKNCSKLPTDSTKKLPTWGEGGVKNPEKMLSLFMDGPLLFKRKNLHAVDISSTPYLSRLVNVVKERPLSAWSLALLCVKVFDLF